MKQAILLLTNRTDYAVRDRYDKLVSDYGKKADVFLLFDNSSLTDNRELEHFKRIYTFNVPELIAEGYTALEEGFLGNCHYPILKFYQDYPEYNYYWRIEDDVVFSGDWSVLFDAFANDASDLVSGKIRTYMDDPSWYWWESVKTPKGVILSPNEMYASFTPVFRLSAKSLDCLADEMCKGWRGHFEARSPTIIARHGMSMRDMGGEGRFVNPSDVHRFYTEDTHTWIPLRVQPMTPNKIYHPIKEKISRRSYRRNCLLSIVGKNSCHKEWMTGNVDRNFDIHLIIYDSSFTNHYDDADFAYGKNGRKTELIIDYFNHHQQMLSHYDYYFIIDEKWLMTANQINHLFDEMVNKKHIFCYVGKNMACFSHKIMRVMKIFLRVLDILVKVLRRLKNIKDICRKNIFRNFVH